MRILNPDLTEASLWDRIARAPARALLLDYDGTLAPFSGDRQQALMYPGIREALERIASSGSTRLAIVSGRPAHALAPLLDLSKPIEVWGSHGLERLREDGTYEAKPIQADTVHTVRAALSWIAARGWEPLTEPKPFGLALHARGAAPGRFEEARLALLDQWQEPLRAAGLEPLEFDGGIEWRPEGSHKGEVVEIVLSEIGPAGALCYLGDDRTDEDAFAVLAGRGLSGLVRDNLRPTAADFWLRPPAQLLDFLEIWRRKTGERN